MARVSIEGLQESESHSHGGSKPHSTHASSSGHDHPAGVAVNGNQTFKAVIAVVVIMIAAGFIAWNAGLLDSTPKTDPNAAPEATPEEIRAGEEAKKQAEEALRLQGSPNPPPMPLGSN